MARPQTAFWAQPGKSDDQVAADLLDLWRPAILGRIEWYERSYPGEVDWESVIWMGAYRAVYAYQGPGPFWPLLKLSISNAVSNPMARRQRRMAKLNRVAINLEDRLYYYERWDQNYHTKEE